MGAFILRLFGSDGIAADANIKAVIFSYIPLLTAALLFSTPLPKKLYKMIKNPVAVGILDNALCILVMVICTAELVSSDYNPFLYFKF